MEHLDRFNPAFTEVAKGVADSRAGDRKARVNAAIAELTPLLPLTYTSQQHLGGYQLPGSQVATMAVTVHNQKVSDNVLLPVQQLVNSDDANSVLADVIQKLQEQRVQNAPERVAALYIASILPKIKGTPNMRQLTHRTREIRRLAQEFHRRLHGAIRGSQEEKGLHNMMLVKGQTGLKRGGKWRTRKRTRMQRTGKSKKGRKTRKPSRRIHRR